MSLRAFCLLLSLSFPVAKLLGESSAWRPPIPAGCPSADFEAILIDNSRSMLRRDLFHEVQQNVAEHIRNAVPACTLEVIAAFGLTADVQDAAFLTDSQAREKLVRTVMTLKPEQRSTNMDEAAKLVELLSYELHASYGAAADRLVVRVYSDFESSPSTGKPNVSLAEYLSKRMGARYFRAPGEASAENQIFDLRASTGAEKTGSPEAGAPRRVRDLLLAIAVASGLLLSLLALLWFRSIRRRGPRLASIPGTLLVTESTIGAGEAAQVVGLERRVEVAQGVPAVFSTDQNLATYIAAEIPGELNGELFRIEPLLDGSVRVQSPHARLTVNNEPLNVDRRLTVDVREPIRIRLGRREFNIIGVFDRPRTFEQTDDVFNAEALRD